MRTSCWATTLLLALASLGCDTPAGSGSDAGGADAGVDTATDAGSAADAGCLTVVPCASLGMVVSPGWLEEHLDDADLQILDTRDASSHEANRIPGSLWIDPNSLRATVDSVPGQVTDLPSTEAVLRAAGLRRDARVVVYGSAIDTSSARVLWTLRYYGHEPTHYLDGGFGRWSAEARRTESGAHSPTPSSYTIDAAVDALRVDAAWVNDHLSDATVDLVDARTPSEWSAGRIPGAINVDWTENVADTGSFKSLLELSALYTDVDPDATVIAYCQTGSRASVAWLALSALGWADVRLYDGSWAEWGSDADLPREP